MDQFDYVMFGKAAVDLCCLHGRGLLVGWFFGWLFGCLVVWLVCSLVGWLVACLVFGFLLYLSDANNKSRALRPGMASGRKGNRNGNGWGLRFRGLEGLQEGGEEGRQLGGARRGLSAAKKRKETKKHNGSGHRRTCQVGS